MVTVNKMTAPTAVAPVAGSALVERVPLPEAANSFAGAMVGFLGNSIGTAAQPESALPVAPSYGPFVGCATEQSDNYNSVLKPRGIADGDYFICVDGVYTKITTNFKHWIIEAVAYDTNMNQAGDIVASKRHVPGQQAAKPFQEHIVALLIVDIGEKLAFVKGDFRGTKWQTLNAAYKEVTQQVHLPTWANQTEAHKVAAAIPVPCLRVTGFATTSPRVSKESGNPYAVAKSWAMPTTAEDAVRLSNFMKRPEAVEEMALVQKAVQERRELFEKKLIA